MASMIRCDGCEKLFYSDSRTEKGAYHLVSIDHGSGPMLHVCNNCYDAMMRNIFHMVWNSDEEQYVDQTERKE